MRVSFLWIVSQLFLFLVRCPTADSQTLPSAQQLLLLAPLAINGVDEIKPLVEKLYSRKLDWGALAERDRRTSQILISISEETQ